MALNEAQVTQAADLLAETFQARTTIDGLPEACAPANAAEAVQVQVAMLERLGLEASGYKAGFTNPPMLEKAGPDGPMAGVMFRDFTINSGGSLKRSDVGPGALIEAEVSFRMGADLPAREGGYSEDEVIAAVDSAILGIEFAVPRLSNPMGQPMVHLAADNGAAMAFVAGPDIPDWKNRDLKQLGIELLFDGGKVVSEGLPLPARCDERWALAHGPINHFSARGIGIRGGRPDHHRCAAAAPIPLGTASEDVWRGLLGYWRRPRDDRGLMGPRGVFLSASAWRCSGIRKRRGDRGRRGPRRAAQETSASRASRAKTIAGSSTPVTIPWSAIGRVNSRLGGFCTGTVIGPRRF